MKPVIKFECVSDGIEAKPMYACGHCKMLGAVSDSNNDLQAAERCCLCTNCGTRPREKHWTLCAECNLARRERQEIELRERLNALPEEDHTGGPVRWGDEYYADLESALDDLDEDELLTAIVHPCDVCPVELPDVVSWVEEFINDQLDLGTHGWELSEGDEAALSNAIQSTTPPNIWVVRDNVRLTRSWLSEE